MSTGAYFDPHFALAQVLKAPAARRAYDQQLMSRAAQKQVAVSAEVQLMSRAYWTLCRKPGHSHELCVTCRWISTT